jgi:aryl-alcohol dehydrogenase-like predicted oxidoreductase
LRENLAAAELALSPESIDELNGIAATAVAANH